MKSLPHCPLLRTHPSQDSSADLVCFGGVNFCAVGANRELCRRCKFLNAGLEELLECRLAAIHTFLRYDDDYQPFVDFEVYCFAMPEDKRCANCPEVAEHELSPLDQHRIRETEYST